MARVSTQISGALRAKKLWDDKYTFDWNSRSSQENLTPKTPIKGGALRARNVWDKKYTGGWTFPWVRSRSSEISVSPPPLLSPNAARAWLNMRGMFRGEGPWAGRVAEATFPLSHMAGYGPEPRKPLEKDAGKTCVGVVALPGATPLAAFWYAGAGACSAGVTISKFVGLSRRDIRVAYANAGPLFWMLFAASGRAIGGEKAREYANVRGITGLQKTLLITAAVTITESVGAGYFDWRALDNSSRALAKKLGPKEAARLRVLVLRTPSAILAYAAAYAGKNVLTALPFARMLERQEQLNKVKDEQGQSEEENGSKEEILETTRAFVAMGVLKSMVEGGMGGFTGGVVQDATNKLARGHSFREVASDLVSFVMKPVSWREFRRDIMSIVRNPISDETVANLRGKWQYVRQNIKNPQSAPRNTLGVCAMKFGALASIYFVYECAELWRRSYVEQLNIRLEEKKGVPRLSIGVSPMPMQSSKPQPSPERESCFNTLLFGSCDSDAVGEEEAIGAMGYVDSDSAVVSKEACRVPPV